VNPDFRRLVDTEGLTPEEEARLRRVHDLLVEAGPPPELTTSLRSPPRDEALDGAVAAVVAEPAAEVRPTREAEPGGVLVPLRRRRLAPVALVAAAAIAAACFGGGYLLANRSNDDSFTTVRVVGLQGEQNSLASLRLGAPDANGNWPMDLTVDGLPKQTSRRAYYVLLLVDKDGKPSVVCGTFRVEDGQTTVRFTVPYKISDGSRWVVTALSPGVRWPGPVVMTTA
jgi:hypothetical protein